VPKNLQRLPSRACCFNSCTAAFRLLSSKLSGTACKARFNHDTCETKKLTSVPKRPYVQAATKQTSDPSPAHQHRQISFLVLSWMETAMQLQQQSGTHLRQVTIEWLLQSQAGPSHVKPEMTASNTNMNYANHTLTQSPATAVHTRSKQNISHISDTLASYHSILHFWTHQKQF
jgi:hypothetical protein